MDRPFVSRALGDKDCEGSRRGFARHTPWRDTGKEIGITNRVEDIVLKLELRGRPRTDNDFVFAYPDGTPLDPSTVTHVFGRVVHKAGLELRLHDLRHSYTSIMIAAGVNIKAISQSMGKTAAERFDKLLKPWLKSFTLSVLSSRKEAVSGSALEKEYFDRISKMAWRKLIEDDPIMLYWRARECENSGKYSRAVTCLKDILKEYPYFIHARIKIIEACYRMIKAKDKIPSEMIFVRDTAEELLEKYEGILSENEKKQLKEILESIKALDKKQA